MLDPEINEEELCVKNSYYKAKSIVNRDPSESLKQFQQILDGLSTDDPLQFKILKKIINFDSLEHQQRMDLFLRILRFQDGQVRRCSFEKFIIHFIHSLSDDRSLFKYCLVISKSIPIGKYFMIDIVNHMNLCELYFKSQSYDLFHEAAALLKNECSTTEYSQHDEMKKMYLYKVMCLEMQTFCLTNDYSGLKATVDNYHELVKERPTKMFSALAHESSAYLSIWSCKFIEALSLLDSAYKIYLDVDPCNRKNEVFKTLLTIYYLHPIIPSDFQYSEIYKERELEPQFVPICDLIQKSISEDNNETEDEMIDEYRKSDSDTFFIKNFRSLLNYRRIKLIEEFDKKVTYTYEDFKMKFCCNNEQLEHIVRLFNNQSEYTLYMDQIQQILVFRDEGLMKSSIIAPLTDETD